MADNEQGENRIARVAYLQKQLRTMTPKDPKFLEFKREMDEIMSALYAVE